MLKKDWKKDILTIPNLLSLFRLVLIPVYVILYLNAAPDSWTDHLIAAGVFAVSCITDMLDGKIARRFNMISSTGKLLDPVADKLTQLAVILCLLVKYPVLKWLMILFVVKEVFQLFGNIYLLRKGLVLNGALMSGKISTTILFLTMIVMILVPRLELIYIYIFSILDAIVLLIAMVDYGRLFFTKNDIVRTIDEEMQEGQ